MKRCPGCGVQKPHHDYYKNKRRKDGVSVYCKVCFSEKRKERYERNKSKYNKRSSDYYFKNKEKIMEAHKRWRAKDKERTKKMMHNARKQWERNNKHVIREKGANRRANEGKASLGGAYKKETRKIYKLAHSAGMTVDHIWPIKGENFCGLHVPWNLQIMTSEENTVKYNHPPDVWEIKRIEKGFA